MADTARSLAVQLSPTLLGPGTVAGLLELSLQLQEEEASSDDGSLREASLQLLMAAAHAAPSLFLDAGLQVR